MFTVIALVIALILANQIHEWAVLIFFSGLIIDLLVAVKK